ncbi:Ankyrin Repeat And Sam Domain-Containing Protein 3 [Manis pentadactyla]|nr:Ankyrin Repeat And Sam Domain-Containing Protein 3 [Manis pentadactyla]
MRRKLSTKINIKKTSPILILPCHHCPTRAGCKVQQDGPDTSRSRNRVALPQHSKAWFLPARALSSNKGEGAFSEEIEDEGF